MLSVLQHLCIIHSSFIIHTQKLVSNILQIRRQT